jgi:hypothetical protein
MSYHYEINPRPVELGGGWKVRLLEGDEEMGGGVFPPREAVEGEAIKWWRGLSESERDWWAQHYAPQGGGMDTADLAYSAYLREEAYQEAQDFANEWLGLQH